MVEKRVESGMVSVSDRMKCKIGSYSVDGKEGGELYEVDVEVGNK